MPVQIIESGNLFEAKAGAYVNPVNCVGIMGKGLAEIFKRGYPENYRAYRAMCDRSELEPGGLFAFDAGADTMNGPRWIVNLATKDHWKDPTRIEWVRDGARALREWAESVGCRTIACPALGAGYGGLEWEHVRPEIEKAFEGSAVELLLFAPHAPPAAKYNRMAYGR